MHILILGGGGFLGKRLALELLSQSTLAINGRPAEPISGVVLFDRSIPDHLPKDSRLKTLAGDMGDREMMKSILSQSFDVIFHLAAVVSGEAERNFDLGMRVNLHATLNLLELCREMDKRPVLVFSSTCGVFGGDPGDTIRDDTAPTPRSSYGTQKAAAELLMNDYSRRGFVDGRVLRLPTIVVRTGKPNAANSSFASSIIREPLNGQKTTCPVHENTRIWILSPRMVTEHFIHAAGLRSDVLGDNRIITLPGFTTSVKEIVNTLKQMKGASTTDLIDWDMDDSVQRMVDTWPIKFDIHRAYDLGFGKDKSIENVIQDYIDTEL